MKLVIISDTHFMHERVQVPDGDVLVHAGDLTAHGTVDNVEAFNHFLGALPHRHKIVIAGNHDFCFQRAPRGARAAFSNAIYLEDEAVTVEGITFYGSPWQPWFYDWAFNLRRGEALRAKWDLIPADTDVLVTHGPPRGHGDRTSDGRHEGCDDLLAAVERIKPRYHLFGHIHEAAGITRNEHTTFVNASVCDLAYKPVNSAVCLEI